LQRLAAGRPPAYSRVGRSPSAGKLPALRSCYGPRKLTLMIAFEPESRSSGTTPDMVKPSTDHAGAWASDRREPLLVASGLRKSFGGQIVLDGVDLELRRGEVVLLRGENGSGKTTLVNILTGNLEPDSGLIEYRADDSPRSFSFPRRVWQRLNPFDHFVPEFVTQEGIARTWQGVRLFGSQTLRDNITVANCWHPGENPLVALLRPGKSARHERLVASQADEALAGLGLAGREKSSADKVSLGQSKRVAIARAVATGARVLFLDEPFAGLDRDGVWGMLALLRSLVERQSMTLVIVEHVFNEPHLDSLVTTDWLLSKGRLWRNGTPAAERGALFVDTSPWLAWMTDSGTELHEEELPRGAVLTRIRRADSRPRSARPVLEARDLVVCWGNRVALGLDDQGDPRGLQLELSEGEIALLQAPNGWGKSTFLAAAMGTARDVRGLLRLDGADLGALPIWQRAQRGLRVLPSDCALFPDLSVGDLLTLTRSEAAAAGDSGIPAHRQLGSLSGGELQRVALDNFLRDGLSGRALLLDEPFRALDERSAREFASRLSRLAPGRAILITVPRIQS
jgi:branched-chain amino acid transport system ATP-binding protein